MLRLFTTLVSLPVLLLVAQQDFDIIAREADLPALIKVWSKKFGKNFILDERVKGKVTLYLPADLSDQDALNILDLLLHYKGFASVPVGENLYKIVPLKEAKQGTIKSVTTASENSASIVTKIRKLKYNSADEISKVIQPLLGPDGFLSSISTNNSIMIIDSEQNIARIDSIINSLDVPPTEIELTIIPLQHTDAKEMADRIKELFDLGSDSSSLGRLADPARARPQAVSLPQIENVQVQQPSFVRVGAKESNVKVVADERSNSIIVVADPVNTLKIRAIVTQLDSPVNRSGRRFYFYKCRFSRAEDIASTLASLVGGTVSETRSQPQQFSESARRDSLLLGPRQDGSRSGRRLGESRISQDKRQSTGAKISDDLSITADPSTNSIIIYATRSEYEKIISLMKDLDVRKKQVLVEATILEVQLLKQFNSDIDFITSLSGKEAGTFAQKGLIDLASIVQNPLSLSGFTAAVAGVGTLKIADNVVIPSQAALVSAAQASQIANVLSAPQILTLDNEDAEILVGQNVPFVVSQSTTLTNLDNRFNQIDRQDVGITLRIRPQIASEDLVNLNIFLEVSSVVPGTDSNQQGPTTNVRTLETTISGKNGQMIVIGGLITDDASESSDGIPFLRDIPVIGNLFGGLVEKKEKRNLLLFITPRILVDQFDLRDETVVRTNRMRATIQEIPNSVSRDGVLKNPAIDDVLIFNEFVKPNYPPSFSPQKSVSDLSEKPVEKKGVTLRLKNTCKIDELPFKVLNSSACIKINQSDLLDQALSSKLLVYSLQSGDCVFEVLGPSESGNCYELTGYELSRFGKDPWQLKN